MSLSDVASLALSLAKERYGDSLRGLALRAIKPSGACRPYVEVYLFLEELPLEEEDYASQLLRELPRDSYAGLSVFVYTSSALGQATRELREALAEASVAYDKDGQLREMALLGAVPARLDA
ncbi:MAG: hypothetical protein N3H31_06785 [Candidatus Nezhaarchaeota archaeon]|nr:hypothetical protein [Candidatus Nezhaarchaeota archaeon]